MEALRVRREVELPVYERLGDARSAAVTWGQIADIAYQRGHYDEAAELQRSRLEVNKRLGDLDGIAAAGWALARIDLAREDYASAVPRLTESFQIFGRLQRPDGIAIVGVPLGRLLLAGGHADAARRVLSDALAAATKIGWTETVQQIDKLLKSAGAEDEGHDHSARRRQYQQCGGGQAESRSDRSWLGPRDRGGPSRGGYCRNHSP